MTKRQKYNKYIEILGGDWALIQNKKAFKKWISDKYESELKVINICFWNEYKYMPTAINWKTFTRAVYRGCGYYTYFYEQNENGDTFNLEFEYIS